MSFKGISIAASLALTPIFGSTGVYESEQRIEQRSRDASVESAKRNTIPVEQQPRPKVIPKAPVSPQKTRRKLNEHTKVPASEDKKNQSHQPSDGVKPPSPTNSAVHKQQNMTPIDTTCAVLDGPERTDLATNSPEEFESLANKCKR